MRTDRKIVAEALVMLQVDSGRGSAVAVETPAGLRLLTCEHVVRNASSIIAVMRTETEEGEFVFTETAAEVERVNKKWDLALLKFVSEIPTNVKPLVVAKEEPDLYEAVILGACPGGLWGIVVDGVLQGVKGSLGADDNEDVYLFSGLSVPGSSGGAMTNQNQELVGLIQAVSRDDESLVYPLGYATPLKAIRRFALRRPPRHLGVVRTEIVFEPEWLSDKKIEFTPEFGELQEVEPIHEFQAKNISGDLSDDCVVCGKERGDVIHE